MTRHTPTLSCNTICIAPVVSEYTTYTLPQPLSAIKIYMLQGIV